MGGGGGLGSRSSAVGEVAEQLVEGPGLPSYSFFLPSPPPLCTLVPLTSLTGEAVSGVSCVRPLVLSPTLLFPGSFLRTLTPQAPPPALGQ